MLRYQNQIVIVGGGVAGRAALSMLPGARLVARPAETAWHAQDDRLWIESADGIAELRFTKLLICADERLLLHALGCEFRGAWPVVDTRGETSRKGVFAAGKVIGAATAQTAAMQARIAAAALSGQAVDGEIVMPHDNGDAAQPERLDPVALAALLEQSVGAGRTNAALAQARLVGMVMPARPVGLAALAAAAGPVTPGTAQQDSGLLA